jgi:DNA-binding MarR family transcriptional regulator
MCRQGGASASLRDVNDRATRDTAAADAADGGENLEGPRFSYAVGALDRSLRRSLVSILRPFELTVAEYTALSLISRRGGYSNAQLARRSFVSPQAMHEMVSSLEKRGLLERAASESHRSMRHTHLTKQGRDLLDRCNVAVDDMEEAMLEGVPPGRRDEVIALLIQSARNLRDIPANE